MRDHTPVLLSTADMATFVARGVLILPGVIDDPELNATAMTELERIDETWGTPARERAPGSGEPWDEIYPEPSAIGRVIRHPRIAGAILSLVGPGAVFDHDFVHVRPARDLDQQRLHADAVIDPNTAFDIQIFYFPHEVAADGGGTGYVPGTHLRTVHETDVGRYQHIRGERQWEGPAGSIAIFHHGLWHRGMANPGPQRRVMYKIRLNPTAPQIRLWDTTDLDELQNDHTDHIFARFDPAKIGATLRWRERWMGHADHRLELVARARLWRYLTGDERYDLDWYLTRLEGRAGIDRGTS